MDSFQVFEDFSQSYEIRYPDIENWDLRFEICTEGVKIDEKVVNFKVASHGIFNSVPNYSK